MRVALAEALIARELFTSIFKDFHDLDSIIGMEEGRLVGIIKTLTKTHPLQATIIRCQISRVCCDSDGVAAVPSHAAERVATVLDGWFGSHGPQRQPFVDELEALFSDAMELWKPLQRSPKHIAARADLSDRFWFGEDKRSVYDERSDGQSQVGEERDTSTLEDPMVVLFPQIVTEGGEDLFHGYALFCNQYSVMAATRERASQHHLRRRPPSRIQPRPAQRSDATSFDTMRHSTFLTCPPSDLSYVDGGVPIVNRGAIGNTDPESSME